MRWCRRIAAGLLGGLLVACGGGSGDGPDPGCTVITPNGNFVLADFYYPDGVVGTVGQALAASPTVRLEPGGCVRQTSFAVSSGALPPGLALERSTGLISGTPTQDGYFEFSVAMTVAGVEGSLTALRGADIRQAGSAGTAPLLKRWEEAGYATELGVYGRLGAIGGKLFGITWNRYQAMIETYAWLDDDWTQLKIAGPGNIRDFALSSDGTFIHLAGGLDGAGLTSQVWRFDGSKWIRMAAPGAFQPRKAHSMLSHAGALYLLGGVDAAGRQLQDTWKSTDSGITWTLVSAAGFEPRSNFCAVSNGASLFVMGGETESAKVWRSTEGASWAEVPIAVTSPLRKALATGSGTCALLGDRIVFVGKDGALPGQSSSASSTNGTDWSFAPHMQWFSFVEPGAAVLDGRMYVIHSLGSSSTTLVRSVP